MISLTMPTAPSAHKPERTRPPLPIQKPGPVLMADILTAPGGRPTLLTLWAKWEDRTRS